MRTLILFFLSLPLFAVTCTNSGGDAAAIQAALTAGGAISISGTCALGTSTLNATAAATITGVATLNYTGSGYIFSVSANSVSISGLTLNGGGINTTQNNQNTPQSDITISGNTFQNITNGSNGINGDGIWLRMVIDGNHFNTITTVPVGSITSSTTNDAAYGCAAASCAGLGIDNENGMDHSSITNNTFDVIMGDAIRVTYNWILGTSNTYHTADSNVIAYNVGTRVHRMFVETQGAAGTCPGGCTGFNRVSNYTIKGNWSHSFIAPYGNTYGFSYPVGATVAQFINNTVNLLVSGSNGATGYGLESGNNGEINQGNVVTANTAVTTPYGVYDISGWPGSGSTVTQQNNYLAGPLLSGHAYYGEEGTNFGGTFIRQYNVTASTCDVGTACDTSNVSTGSSTITPSGSTAVFPMYATGELSIKNVVFKLDGTAVATQELASVNTNFTSDRKWPYSHTYSGLASGSHTVAAVATDVSGATSTTSQTFTIAGGATEVNNISFNAISHGSASINFTTLTASVALRMRLTVSPTSCSGGTGGSIINGVQATYRATFNQFPLTGLAPATTYNVCPEVAKAGSPTVFSTGATASLTTLALPTVHPARPIKPIKFDTRVPANVGSYATGTVLPDCSNLGSLYVTAVGLQATNGTVISYPAGVNCLLTAGSPYQFGQHTPDIHDWLATDVDLATSSIIWPSHGFNEGELVSFGRSYGTVVTYPSVASCNVGSGSIFLGGIQSGQRYPVHVIDSSHIRPYCLDGTTLMTFTDQGSVQAGQTFYAVPYRQFLNTTDNEMQWARRLPSGAATPWIIFRSAATDAQLTPEHVQITAAHETLMAKLIDPAGNVRSGTDYAAGMIYFGGGLDANIEIPIGNIRLGPGIEITTEDYGATAHSSDPWYYQNVLVTYPWASGIVFDRIWYKLLDTTNRANVDMVWNGSNVAAVDSMWTGLTYWHANNVGLAINKVDATHFTIASGTAYSGATAVPLTSAVTVSLSGSGTGRVRAYFDLLNGNALTIAVPSGITAACSGATCVSAASSSSSSGRCNPAFKGTDVPGGNDYTENASDAWPRSAKGEVTVNQIGCADVTSGSITTAGLANPGISLWNAEADSHMLGGIGPGPCVMSGNFSEGAGITWFWDDSGDSHFRGNYTLSRNYFNSSLRYLLNNPASDHKSYFHRQGVEWKAGVSLDIRGNHFNGGWIEDNNNSPFIAMTVTPSNSGNGAPPMSDIDIHENIFEHGGAMLEGPLVYCTGASLPCSPPIGRVRVHGNVAYDINGYTYTANNPNSSSANNTPANGWLGALVATEDFVFDHNTILPTAGHFPWMFSIDHFQQEGFTVTNNILWYTLSPGVSVVFGPGNQTFCTSLGTRAFMDCAFTSGPGVPSYTFGNNLIAGGWLDSSVPSGQNSSAAMTTAFGGLANNYFTSGGTVPATMAALKWLNSDFTSPSFDLHLLDASPIKAGNNTPDRSADVGADINKLYAAIGRLTVQGVADRYNGTTTASVAYTPADSGVCYIDISTTDPNAVTGLIRFTDAGGSRSRLTALTGLTTKTFYYGVVRCSGNSVESQKPFTFKTN